MPSKRPSLSKPPKRAVEKHPRVKRPQKSLDQPATSPTASKESEQQYRALYASAQRQARELQLLHKVRTALGRDLELPILFRTIVESTAEIFGYLHVSLYLLEADWLVLQHQVGFDQNLIMAQISIAQGISGRVVRSGQAVLLEDVHSDPDFLAAAEGVTSEVCAPLFDQGRVVGMLNVESTHGAKLSEADLQLMLVVSEYVSLALERARLYSQLRESEKRYKELVNSAGDVIYKISPSGHFTFVNPALIRTTGYTEQELIGTLFLKLIRADYRKTAALFYRKQFKEKIPSTYFEFPAIAKNGEVVWIGQNVQLIMDATGDRALEAQGITRDITSRVQADEALRASEEQFRTLFENAPIGIGVADLQGNLLAFNDAIMQPGGYNREDILKLGNVAALYYDSQQREDAMALFQQQGTLRNYAVQFKRKDGSFYEALLSLIPTIFKGQPCLQAIVEDITDRKRIEEELRASESRFRRLTEATTEGLVFHDKGQIIDINPALISMFGYETASEVVGRNLLEFVAPESREAVLKQMQSGTTEAYEAVAIHRAGWTFPVEASARLYEYRGRTIRVASIRDITDRKRAERIQAALYSIAQAAVSAENLNDLYRLIHHALSQLLPVDNFYIALYDANTDLISFPYFVDERDESLAPKRLGRGLTEYVLRTGRPLLADPEMFARLTQQGEVELIGMDSVDWLGVPLKIGPEVIGVMAMQSYTAGVRFSHTEAEILEFVSAQVATVIERKQAEEALRQYTERLAILHEIDQAILAAESIDEIAHAALSRLQRLVPSWRAQVILLDLNNGEAFSVATYENGTVAPFGQRTQLSTLNVVESLWRGELHIVEDLAQLQPLSPHDQQLSAQGIRAYIDAPLMALNKMIGYLTFDSKEPGIFRGAVVDIVREVADQLAIAIQNAHLLEQAQLHAQELEAQAAALSHALEQQRELDRLQREFSQNVSHELRTPLALVLGHAELLESGEMGDLLPEQKESLSVIVRRARMLRKLIEMVIGVSEIENRPLKKVPVDFGRLVQSLLTDFQTAAQSSGLTLSVEIAPDMPPIDGDELALLRVVDNLVGNALKFTPTGGRVDVRLSPHEQTILLEVSDNGVGIPSDKLPHIFDRFYQGDSGVSRRFGGLGLGLALVKDIVDGHHGWIEVESQVGHGTTFRIWFPLNTAITSTIDT
jgi:PAS domain S-box-containing protein